MDDDFHFAILMIIVNTIVTGGGAGGVIAGGRAVFGLIFHVWTTDLRLDS